MSSYLKNIALIGASGSIGKPTLHELLALNKHNLTVITRTSSQAVFPPGVDVRKGEYDDEEFMVSALKGQDVLVIMLAFEGLHWQGRVFELAAKAGVRYVLPCEYGMDSQNDKVCKTVPMIQAKREDQVRIRELGMKFIAVVTNLWTDYMIEHRAGGFDVVEKKATVFPDSCRWHTTTQAQIGRGIAAMLALPARTIEKDFANGWLYLTSFQPTHEEMFAAIFEATGTKESDWTIERKAASNLIEDGQARLKAGDRLGVWDILHGAVFADGYAGEYLREPHNDMLGLPKEDLVETIRVSMNKMRV